jgi:hypothetical protein
MSTLTQMMDFLDEGKILSVSSFAVNSSYKNKMRVFVKNIENMNIENQTIIYYDCNISPDLLDDGELNSYLIHHKNNEVHDKKIKEKITNQTAKGKKIFYILYKR